MTAVRTRCLLTAACFVVAAGVLAFRAPSRGGPEGTLYPWWAWLLVAVGTVGRAGRAPGRATAAAAAAADLPSCWGCRSPAPGSSRSSTGGRSRA